MTEKKLSTLGYLMDRLGLSTAGLARRLHVDASLVSKWRSGNRRLHVKSVYFEDICEMLLEQDRAALCDALRSLIPLEEAKAPMDTAILLRRVLTDRHFTVPRAFTLRTEAVCTAEIAVYTSTEGRRQAISDLLDVAEAWRSLARCYMWILNRAGGCWKILPMPGPGSDGCLSSWTGDLPSGQHCTFPFLLTGLYHFPDVQPAYIPSQCALVLSSVL